MRATKNAAMLVEIDLVRWALHKEGWHAGDTSPFSLRHDTFFGKVDDE
jgi:hypothetical protein